jgi:[ribosomal protein S5]-alanine N-acetyltransferase
MVHSPWTINWYMKIIFETERLTVRRYTGEDTGNFFLLSGDEQVMQYIRAVSTRAESDKFLLDNIAFYGINPHRGRWAVMEKSSGSFAGSFAIIPLPWDAEKMQLGYSLLPRNWGKGYATELTRAGLDYFFTNDVLPEIHGVTETPNIASQKVLLKTGFQPLGKRVEEGKELLIFIKRK